ncbi:MAG: hypothetical protein PVG90_06770 [Bacillota bacterium]
MLKLICKENFDRLIFSPDWTFIPEQWQVQMWAKVYAKIPIDHYIYYSPQLSKTDFDRVPGVDGNLFLSPEKRYHGDLNTIPAVIEAAVQQITEKSGPRKLFIAYLADGPYGIPVR